MSWTSIDTQEQLDALENAVCWEDARVVEYHAGSFGREYFPRDVSRFGEHPNIHMLLEDNASWFEFAFIHCDHLEANVFQNFYVSGQVRSLKRVELASRDGSVRLRCSRLIWRRVLDVDTRTSYYSKSD